MHESGSHRPFGISIHALRKESDQKCLRDFQSVVISIHALRKESDATSAKTLPWITNFNPRSP